jgi:SNF2 family DNA or RNA helicase
VTTQTSLEENAPIEVSGIDLDHPIEVRPHPRFMKPLEVTIRQGALLTTAPWVRSLGKLALDVTVQGWKFPLPPDQIHCPVAEAKKAEFDSTSPIDAMTPEEKALDSAPDASPTAPVSVLPVPLSPVGLAGERTHLRPPRDTVLIRDRLLYLLQPPLESMFSGCKITLPFPPFPYQVKGIAFLMPRSHALLADEMGLGKTAQVILALRLLFNAGLIQNTLIVCPKPLVTNWSRELRLWAPDVPFEVLSGDTEQRHATWQVSNCPVKLVNYELLTRDAAEIADEKVKFDIVVLDEAQRIKSHDSKTAQVVRSLKRDRSWAMTGTPIENRVEDLINIFAFVDPKCIPPDAPMKMLPSLTSDYILRRTKEMVASDMPPRIIKDVHLELSPAQRASYEMAEKEGIVQLNNMGDTITVQHVFELVMRLKQICNFDLRTGQSTKLDQLVADMEEVAANGRKAIVFSQWTEPLEIIAKALKPYNPLLYHGKVPHNARQVILDQFKSDPSKHVILMSYGTGSVGLNLQFTNYVFLYDRWWNPAIEDQAINRAHRQGQKATVFVSRFVTPGTIEARIAEILETKRALFQEMLDGNGPPPTLGLSEDELFGLFDIQARPKRG